jgi:hypothetical protein
MKATWADYLTMIGFVFDIVGGLFIARSVIAKKLREANREFCTWGGGPLLRNSFIQQQVEAIYGGIALLIGFSLQFISYVSNFEWLYRYICGAILLGVLIFLSLLFSSTQVSKRIIKKAECGDLLKEIKDAKISNPNIESNKIDEVGKKAGLIRSSGENDLDFLTRIEQSLSKYKKYAL